MAGNARLTADGAVLTSGKPVRCFGWTVKSGVAGPGLIIFYNGTDATGTEFTRAQGATDDFKSGDFGPEGHFFPAGLYLDLDANVTYIDLSVELVQS